VTKQDKHLQSIQLNIVKAENALALVTEGFVSPDKMLQPCEALVALTDAIALLGQERREGVVRSLHPSYRGLNSTEVPVTKFLFGDDILKTIMILKGPK
jgi:hypothetical protein